MNTMIPGNARDGTLPLTPLPSPPPASHHDELRRQFRWAWRVVWRGKHLILACLLPVLLPTFLYLQQLTPRYTAETRIAINAPEVRNALDERLSNVRPWLTEQLVQTEADLLTSTILAQRAIEKLKLKDDPEFNPTLRTPTPFQLFMAKVNPLAWLSATEADETDEAQGRGDNDLSPGARKQVTDTVIVQSFLSRLAVKATRRSYTITVAYTSESREKAALIANTMAELYLLDRLEASFEESRRIADWLGGRLEALQQDVEAAERAAESFRAEYGLRRRDDQRPPKEQQFAELSSKLVIARAELAQRQARLQQVRELGRAQGGINAISDVLQSPLIQRLREQEAQRSREMSEAHKTYGDRHPRMLGMRADLEDLRRRISDEVSKVASAIASEVEVASIGVRELERELEKARQISDKASGAEVRLRELERQADTSRAVYETFLGRFKRETEQQQIQRANARIVSPAEIPSAASYPAKRQTLGIALIMALLGGVALVFLLDRLDNAVRSGDEAEELTDLPVLAMVPLNRRRHKAGSIAEDVIKNPRSSLADAVRSLRTALDLAGGKQHRVTMITSSVPREGKTYASLCLSLLLARTHGRVLLLDADVHRPNMFRMLDVDGDRGLVQVLSGELDLDDVIQPGVVGGLDFLPAGKAMDVAESISQDGMAQLIERLSERYDQIIIDSPPTLAVADTRVLATVADRIIYLIKWNATPRDAVRNGIKLLRAVGAPMFGCVLSQVNQRKHYRYGYGDYGYYYGRYHEYYGAENR